MGNRICRAMGNRICKVKGLSGRGHAIEERFTKPHRLVRQPSDVDYRKLRKLILSKKLAPCFDGAEDFYPDLEECPICFFYYPSLNRSRCCMKGICTECFLQMKPSDATDRPAQCPFCKFSTYAVEFRGAKTEVEKSREQAEEQKVIEAKIRMQSDDVDCFKLADCISFDVEAQAMGSNFGPCFSRRGNTLDGRDLNVSASEEMTTVTQSMDLNYSNGRHEDLEDIMMTEAIWQSIQDLDQPCRASITVESRSSGHESNQCGPSLASMNERDIPSADSINAGLAVAIARMAEHNIQWPEMLPSNRENNHSSQNFDGVGSTGASAGCEINEGYLEGGCLESRSSTSEDDSWESLAARVLEENAGLGSLLDADRDLLSQVVNDDCCSSSSISILSDGSGEGSHCFNDGADTSHSHLSNSTVVQPVMMVPNAA